MKGSDISNGPGSSLRMLCTAGCSILFAFLVVAAGISIMGYTLSWRAEIVLSGSMEPVINVGELVIARPISPEDIRAGDILMYASTSGKNIICHRVVSVEDTPSLRFVTRGDVNQLADPDPVLPSRVIGIVCFHAPYLGYVLHFVKSPLIILAMIAFIAFIVIVPERIVSRKSRK